MPLRRSQRRALLQRRRHNLRSASRYRSAELVAREAHAIGNESLRPARYGQNNPTIALNRKNALFAGHDQGAENWALIASLIETCKLHDVDPQAYFADVLVKLVNLWPASRIDELMPWARGAANRIVAPEKAAA
jgi:hypothetical protein